MAGKTTVNVVQVGDSATASQNFHLKTNVDGTLSLNRGNDGSPIETVLSIDANGVIGQKAQSMVRLNGPNGFGSVNTGVRLFSTIVTNQGTDITYTNSATLGARFTINKAGVYAISYTDAFSGAADMAICLNSTAAAIPATLTQILAETSTASSAYRACVSVTAYLVPGDVISPAASGAGTSRAFFTITRVA